MAQDQEYALGIDLGTTNCCAAYCWYTNKLNFKIIEHGDCSPLLPSIVTYSSKNGEPSVGNKGGLVEFPETTIINSKRFIGLSFNDPGVVNDSKFLPYKTINRDDKVGFELTFNNNKDKLIFTPTEIATQLLREIKNNADNTLNKNFTKAVVTVPAYFNNNQRNETKLAAKRAGFNEVYILDEPVAAALAYGYETDFDTDSDCNLLVFDLGGGTFDVSIVCVKNGDEYEVLAKTGDSHLGGTDFDHCLFEYFKNDLNKKHRIDVTSNNIYKTKLLNACEKAKINLSKNKKAEFDIQFGSYCCTLEITRDIFEKICQKEFEKTKETIDEALKLANIESSSINHIILVGCSSSIPYISKSILREKFTNSKISNDVNPAEVVARGAAQKAAFISGNIHGNISEIKIRNKTSLSFGVSVVHGKFFCIVPKNTEYPIEQSKVFQTVMDNQQQLRLSIYQGERPYARNNYFLGSIRISVTPLPESQAKATLRYLIESTILLNI
ncbi:uncharacterized protein SAPINGB_P002694 [Magnusiomyces paraingens]|uniref:Heat shock protein 70 n=1 Tax=Magnusiomyces paraingens TaxID=2606893 RepID=A0A5E8BF95_9ASCO|nr:uncharacterized protein SAPINGB_P002694 [Saprochaete ingens]VVT50294.1 unnamed protein product [Saprochaete ingens]